MAEIFFYSILVMLASLVGVFSVWNKLGRVIERNLSLLVSFSAGVFVIIAYELEREALHHSDSLILGLSWVILGALAVWLLFRILPTSHHHHDHLLETSPHSRIDARHIIVSDALHNVTDGILLAASFAVSPSFGMLTALSVFVHELVQEMSEFFVLKQAGYSTKRALGINFAVSSTILVGALGGFYLLERFEVLEAPLLGMASGAFLVVVFHDLIPHSVRASKYKNLYSKHLFWFLKGVALMLVINILLGH